VEIFISVERVQDNSNDFKVPFETELKRVMVHGVLHYCGYKDKGEENELVMRSKEDENWLCSTWNSKSQSNY
jgi:rRNA maturation RNase YbeY